MLSMLITILIIVPVLLRFCSSDKFRSINFRTLYRRWSIGSIAYLVIDIAALAMSGYFTAGVNPIAFIVIVGAFIAYLIRKFEDYNPDTDNQLLKIVLAVAMVLSNFL